MRPASALSSIRFQSTLPHGSDRERRQTIKFLRYFNPRSLTGATAEFNNDPRFLLISIHAPSRERQLPSVPLLLADMISIHAPSRERQRFMCKALMTMIFQSTLPHGSDLFAEPYYRGACHFNPRSLTGATRQYLEHKSLY